MFCICICFYSGNAAYFKEFLFVYLCQKKKIFFSGGGKCEAGKTGGVKENKSQEQKQIFAS